MRDPHGLANGVGGSWFFNGMCSTLLPLLLFGAEAEGTQSILGEGGGRRVFLFESHECVALGGGFASEACFFFYGAFLPFLG